MRYCLTLLTSSLLAALLSAQQTVDPVLGEQSWFTDRAATALVYFDKVVEQPEPVPKKSDDCRILNIEVEETPGGKKGESVAVIRFLPAKPGLLTLPPLEFVSGEFIYQTKPVQIMAGEPQRSAAMSLTLKPAAQRVYAGEPLRIDLTWDCSLPAASLKALNLQPSFFTDPGVEVVIPRSTTDAEQQVGIPIGGRRVIAKRTHHPGQEAELGLVELPLYLRFKNPGTHTLPPVRLECAQLNEWGGDFGRYAAYFNNGLFESVDTSERYGRVFTTTPEIQIEVLPLPAEGQGAEFRGLFMPLDIDVSVSPKEIEIGQLMELEIKLGGEAPHGMLELPALSHQPGLRGRFLVDDNCERLWQENGTLFRTRLRALTTSVQAFPSLRFQVFDPAAGKFAVISTEPIPLLVKSSKGRDVIPLKSYEGAAVKLTSLQQGIWHNLEANQMNDIMNTIHGFLNQAFWPLLALGPLCFFILLRVVRERRRRALDPRYRMRAEAYAEFEKLPAGSPGKWAGFLRFMELGFGSGDKAWTVGDTTKALESIGVSPEEIEQIRAMHAAADARDFSAEHPGATFSNLEHLAGRVVKRIGTLLILFAGIPLTPCAKADEWAAAEQLFKQAQSTPAGSDSANALYQDAALRFQAAAESKNRPGEAWNNAGNAWFQSGAIGRSIAAYREARKYRPFDSKITDNLTAARALTLNDVPARQAWWRKIPGYWLKPSLLIMNFLFWGVLLLSIRYRKRTLTLTTIACGLCLLVLTGLLLTNTLFKHPSGVVIVDAVFAKKGPGYAYANAFNEPLHDGLELTIIETRGDWILIELPDSRQCWIPGSQLQEIH